jgi:uncharacterized protein (DUF2336 family)
MSQILPLIDELEAALGSGNTTRGDRILSAITDLFVGNASRFTPEQISIFDDVMTRLIGAIEVKARAELSRRLASVANAPGQVIRMLAQDDDIEIAGSVLTQSERLNDNDLVATAANKSQLHLLAISRRKSLSEAVTDVLVKRGDRKVVHSVVQNTGARFSDSGFKMLVNRSAGDDDLASELATRRDLPRRHFLVLLETASRAVRARLEAEHPAARGAIGGVVAEIAGNIRHDVREASPDFAAALATVERQNRIRRLGEAEIYQYARERKFEETAIALSVLCDTPIDVVERALLDPGAELILILAKVAGLSSTTTKALLLLRATDRGLSTSDLDNALASFDKLQGDTARRVLSFFRTRAKTQPAAGDRPVAAKTASVKA